MLIDDLRIDDFTIYLSVATRRAMEGAAANQPPLGEELG